MRTTIGSMDYLIADQLQIFSTWIESSRTYVCIVANPQAQTTNLITFNIQNNKTTNVTIQNTDRYYNGVGNLNYDPSTNKLLVSYGGTLFYMDPFTGAMESVLQIYDDINTRWGPSYVSTW